MKYMRYLKEKDRCFSISEEIFAKYFKNKEDFKQLFDELKDQDKEKLLKISFFYYYRWWKYEPKIKKQIDEFVLIIFISIIEAIISEADYKDFKSWHDSECLNKNESVDKLWKEYLSHYGTAKKFIYFFRNCLSEKDQDSLLKNFMVFNNENKGFTMLSLENIAKALYELRSNFVHNAEYVPIPSDEPLSSISFCIENKSYRLKNINLNEVLNMTERGIVEYFKKCKENK